MKPTPALGLALVLVVGLGACSRRPPPVTVAPSSAPPAAAAPARPADDSAARRAAEEARVRAEAARAQAALASLIYFDYDSFDIRSDSRAALDGKVPVLRANPGIRMRIAGHTDERGSTEYNIALGMRRAQAAKDYLAGFGLDGTRFETFSLGEDQPVMAGSMESAWSRNRRAEFQVTAGSVGGR